MNKTLKYKNCAKILRDSERANNTNMALMLTDRCQLACRYCFIKHDRQDMRQEILKKSIDLLLTAPDENLELQFFGGEPLLRFDLVKKSIAYAYDKSRIACKNIRFLLTTNGLLLDKKKIEYCRNHDTAVLFSFDGPKPMHSKNRPPLKADKGASYEKILSHLNLLIASKAEYFVNVVFLPQDIRYLKDTFLFLMSLGVKDIQFAYAVGASFTDKHFSLYKKQLSDILSIAQKEMIRFRNLHNDQEPILITPQINIDPQGRVFIGCSAVLSKKFPAFNQLFYIDHVRKIKDMVFLQRTRADQLHLIISRKNTLPPVLLKNLDFGLKIAEYFKNLEEPLKILPKALNDNKRNDSFVLIQPHKRINSIMLMVTTACQMRCSYCEVNLSSTALPEKDICEAIDLVLTTSEPVCQVRFWGGEPLLRWDLIQKGIHYGQHQAILKNKIIKFMITTNGLLLVKDKIAFLKNKPVEIMFSLDGDLATSAINRKCKGKNSDDNSLLQNLKNLIFSDIDYFVNIVVSPATVEYLAQNIAFFKKMGVKKVQLCYQCGIIWPEDKKEKIFTELSKLGYDSLNGFLMNLSNHCEPTMLSQEILIYPGRKIYFDAAIFLEKKFPDLKKCFCLGDIASIEKIDSLYKTKKQLFKIFYDSCTPIQKKIFLNNIDLGLKLDAFMKNFSHASVMSNEHPQFIPIIKNEFIVQHEKLSPLGINAVFLYIEGPCGNDCLFCKRKEGSSFDDLFIIEQKLQRNLKLSLKKLCLIGNEPLFHPDIINVIKIAKRCRFEEIEILTSGELLSSSVFLENILKAGASSFSMPIFASESFLHDHITGSKSSHEKLLKAISNIQKAGAEIFLHTNLLKQNIDDMIYLQHLVKNILGLPFVILPIRPKTANLSFAQLMPDFEEIKSKLSGATSLLGFPLCVTKEIQDNIFPPSCDISDSMKLYFLDQKFIKAKKCASCCYVNRCAGFFKESYDLFSSKHIIPIKNDKF